jgi:hypothetical protein
VNGIAPDSSGKITLSAANVGAVSTSDYASGIAYLDEKVDTAQSTADGAIQKSQKPNGTYSGNGSATKRTITIGGLGRTVVIYSNNGVALVTGYGAIAGSSSGVRFVAGGSAQVNTSGNLVLATTDTSLNANGVTYYYWMI